MVTAWDGGEWLAAGLSWTPLGTGTLPSPLRDGVPGYRQGLPAFLQCLLIASAPGSARAGTQGH